MKAIEKSSDDERTAIFLVRYVNALLDAVEASRTADNSRRRRPSREARRVGGKQMNKEDRAEFRRLKKIERAAQHMMKAFGADRVTSAFRNRKEFPGSGGTTFISNARICILAEALGHPASIAALDAGGEA